MFPKLNSLRVALVLSVGLSLCGGAVMTEIGVAQTPAGTPPQAQAQAQAQTQKSCRVTTDEEIVAAIHEKIKADSRYDVHRKDFNVTSLKRVVTITGWVEGRVLVDDLVKHARTTRCVKKVNSKELHTFLRTTGCLAGQKQCGDICIDRNSPCNIIP